MKIIAVPDNKKIKVLKKNNHINEAFFDNLEDNGELFGNDDPDDYAEKETMKAYTKLAEEELVPQVKQWLDDYNIKDYEIICTGEGIMVDVHNHLYLPNYKFRKLPDTFTFRSVDGNVNFANNRFKDFKDFPRYIKGDCVATFNNILDFTGAPSVQGTLYAEKQRVKTKYPLTHENYLKWRNELLDESCTRVYITTTDEYGILKNINESENYAEVLIEGGSFDEDKIKKVPLINVDVINGIELLNKIFNE